MLRTFDAPFPSLDEAPVIVSRDDFSQLTSTATRVADGSADAAELVNLVQTIEARRRATEWEAQDIRVPIGAYVGDERGYFRWCNLEAELRERPGMPPSKVLWRHGDQEIAVHDHPAVSAEQIARLESLGIATPQFLDHFNEAPFKFFIVSDPTGVGSIKEPTLSVEQIAGPPGGAWILTGPNLPPIAWVKTKFNARLLASATNMALELDQEVARYGGSNSGFSEEIQKSGLLGLIRKLRRSIEPQERWEKEPPEDLRTLGAELERLLVKFLDASRPYRFGKPYRDRAKDR